MPLSVDVSNIKTNITPLARAMRNIVQLFPMLSRTVLYNKIDNANNKYKSTHFKFHVAIVRVKMSVLTLAKRIQ